jgi:hypothetical protein
VASICPAKPSGVRGRRTTAEVDAAQPGLRRQLQQRLERDLKERLTELAALAICTLSRPGRKREGPELHKTPLWLHCVKQRC